MQALTLRQSPRGLLALGLAGAAAAAGLSAGGLPWLTAGAVLGLLLLVLTLGYPLEIVGVMLVLGAVDLSFVTGGFKSLLAGTGGLDMNGIRLVGIVVSLAAVIALNRSMVGQLLAPSGRWYVIFLLFAAGTLVLSPAPLDGLRLFFKLAYPLTVFVVVLGVARTRDVERLADWMLLGAAAVAFVISPVFAIVTGGRADPTGVYRIGSFGLHQNPFSFYLLAALLLSLVRLLERREARYALLALGLVIWMALTYTRITFLAFLVALAVLALVTSWLRRDYRVLVLAAIVAAVLTWALLPVLLARTFGYLPRPGELIDLVRDPARLYGAMNWQGRQVLWPLIFGRFLRSPWVGLGLGATTSILGETFGRGGISVVHNEYLRLIAETGLIGGAVFLLAMVQWWRAALGVMRDERARRMAEPAGRASPAPPSFGSRGLREGSDDGRCAREFASAALALLAAWAVIAVTDNAFDYYAPLTQYAAFFCAAAMVGGLGVGAHPEGTPPGPGAVTEKGSNAHAR